MELLIAGGIAAAGWALSSRGIETRKPPARMLDKPPAQLGDAGTTSSFAEPSMTANDLMKQYDQAAKARWNAAQNPERTGVIGPFFSSVRKQHTNDALKQRRMEVFTGNDPSWRPKREAEAQFAPQAQPVTSSGS